MITCFSESYCLLARRFNGYASTKQQPNGMFGIASNFFLRFHICKWSSFPDPC